ncbi:hypothetical protein BDZ89DRAFT_1061491 [Hymenopellis radicata]|nr:hypothetical protein BDZ89DRAFT_1061491 [Hymenopellis radicata]
MTTANEDAKFPGLHSSGLPPSPTIENPGGVYPQFDPSPPPAPPLLSHQNSGAFIANPFLMNEAFGKLDHALGEVITILENEEFLNWRDQLDTIRTGKRTPSRSPARHTPEREGGLFVD